MERPSTKKSSSQPPRPKKAQKVKQYTQKTLTAEEFARRLKQREAALQRRFVHATSPSIGRVVTTAKISLKGARELLAALIDPDNSPPMRLPGGGKPTFVNKLRNVKTFVPAAGGLVLVPNGGFAVARRDVRCSLIYFQYSATPASTYLALSPAGGFALNLDNQHCAIVGAMQFQSGNEKHGQYMIPWKFSDGSTRIWFQNNATTPSQVAFTNLPNTTGLTWNVNFLLNGAYANAQGTGTSSGTGTLTVTLPTTAYAGYVAISVYITATNVYVPFGFSLLDNETNMVCHINPPQFWNNFTDIDSLRINAYSLMFSDRTASNYSQGEICSYQAAGGDEWPKMLGATGPSAFLGLDPYGQVPTYNDGFKGKFPTGKYIPAKFVDDPREQQMLQITDSSEPYECPPIDMSQQLDYLYIGWNPGVLVSGQVMGEITNVTAVEGESESQWRETQPPRIHPDALTEAKFCFSQVKADFDNPKHLEKIWSWVKANAPHVLDAVSAFAPLFGPKGMAVGAGAQGARQLINAFS